jgi:hypothetical protein
MGWGRSGASVLLLATGTEKGRTRVESGLKRARLKTVKQCGREGPNGRYFRH